MPYETHTMVALPLSMLTDETYAAAVSGKDIGVVAYPKDGLGLFVTTETGGLDCRDTPGDMLACVNLATSLGADWIMFDRDI